MSDYQPLPELSEQLVGKTLIMVIGPTAIGKSSLMNEVASIDSRFVRVGGFTTRSKRANDEAGLYRYVSMQSAEEMIEHHRVIQYVQHPTTADIYGTEPRDYQAIYNMKDVLPKAIEDYRALPFSRVVAISLTTDPQAWRHWLDIRFPIGNDDRTKRLHESKQSIEWSLAQTKDHHWLLNQPDDLSTSAHELIRLVRTPRNNIETPPEATKLLKMVNDLLSYK